MTKSFAIALAAAALSIAAPMIASAHTCYAGSRTGATGWGTSASRALAARIALKECAVRTPRGFVCVLTRCT
jgi:hypothetical protein